jgi:hypothetical protein
MVGVFHRFFKSACVFKRICLAEVITGYPILSGLAAFPFLYYEYLSGHLPR